MALCSQTGTPATQPDLWPPPWDLCVYKMHLKPRDSNPSQYLHFHLKKKKGEMKYQHSTSNSAQPPQNSTHAWTQTIPGCSPRWKHHPSPCWHGSSCTAGIFQPVLAADKTANPFKVYWFKKKNERMGWFFLLNPAVLAVKEFTHLLFLVLTDLHEPGWHVWPAVVWVRDRSTAC